MKTKTTTPSFFSPQWRALAVHRLLSWVAAFSLLLGAGVPLHAQYTYTNGFNWNGGSGVNPWGTAANWYPNTVPNVVDAAASFNIISNGIAVTPNLTINGAFTVGSLWSTNSSAWLIKYGSGAGTLTLQTTPPAQPYLYMGSTSAECWWQSTYMAGTQGFVVNSATASQKFTFRYNGNFMTNFSGPIIVGNGQLGFNGAGNFGYASSLTLSNGTQLTLENANTVPGPTITYPGMPINLAGATATINNNGVGDLVIEGPVQSPGTNTTLTANGSAAFCTIILAGTNTYPGNTTVSGGTLLSSTASTGAGSHTVAVSATDGAWVTAAGKSLVVSNLTLTATTAANSSALAFCPGTAGAPTVPMMNVTNLLTLGNTNFTTPIKLFGGGWQVGSAMPLLHFGSATNIFTNGLFNGFQLAALPSGISAALSDGTATNQINLNITAIAPLIWSPATANANWTNGLIKNWTLNGIPTNYTEAYGGFGPAVQFDDSLTPAGSILVTNNMFVSPNSIVFSNSTHNYTLFGNAGFQNNASLTLDGTGYVTNSLNNVYLGGTFLNAGTLVLNSVAALPSNAGRITFGGGTLQFSANNFNDYSSQFSTAPNQQFSLNTGGKNIALASGLASSGGSLTIAGGGTVILGGVSTYTGGTTNVASTFKLGVANALPTVTSLTLGTNTTSATLDLAGFNQTLAGLTMNPSATAAIVTNSSKVNPAILTFNGGASSFAGSIVDGTANGANGGQSVSLTVAGGSLTLTGQNTYTNTTTITNGGSLFIDSTGSITCTNVVVGSNSLFDVSAITINNGTYPTQPGGSLGGIGNVNGSVEIVGLSLLQPDTLGATANHGTLTVSNNLTLDPAASVNLNVATTTTSPSNDHILVLGQLTANGNTLNLAGPASALPTSPDYTLISAPNSTISGSFNSAPNWVGTPPANAAHYSVVTSANAVTLHYAVGVSLSGAGAVSPATGLHQNYLFTVLVTPGTGSTGIGVTADFTIIGGSLQSFSNVGNLYSYTFDVPGSVAPGTYPVPFTVTDAQSDTFNGNIYVTIANGTLTWNGAGSNNNWSSLDWLNGATPDLSGDAGDALLFAGSTRLFPVMDASYNVTAVTFSNNAGAFNITTSGNTLTLAAGGWVENDSSSTELLEVPISLTSGSQFNTPAGNLIVGPLGNSSDGFTKNGSGKLIIDGTNGASSYSGPTTLAGGSLAITNGDNTLPTGTTVAYTAPATLDLGGQNQSVANLNLSALGAGTVTATNGNLTVTGTSLNLSPNTADTAVTTVDLSGLSTLTYPSGTISFYGAIGANSTVKLAQTNYISANALYVANGGLTAAAPSDTATILLGQSNVLNTGTMQLGGYHNASGAVAFNTGLNNPTLTLRGLSGVGSPVGTMNIGVNNNGSNPSFSFDTRAGSIDAIVNSLYILNNNSGGGSWTDSLSMSNGTLNVGVVYMNYDFGSTTTGSSAVVNQNGGIMLVGNLGLNANVSTGVPTTSSAYNLGNGTNGSGLLSANVITIGATQAIGTNSTATLNFINGTIENYEPALGQADSLGVAQGGSTTTENLDISGLPGGGAPSNSLTLNLVLAATGTHNFYAETNNGQSYTITEEATALISGSGGLTANGPGLVTLLATNTYTGNTTVSAGTLEIAQPCLFWRSSVSVSNGALLQLDFAVTNQVAALVLNGVSKAPGVYNAATDPSYLTNSGSLLVVPLRTNAYLTSLALTPADSLTPNFATNLFVYSATNAFGIKPTVTVTNADLTASNVLIVNGLSLQVLTSGVPSLPISNLGAGPTNVVGVLVTAQDGLTTHLYTVNLTQVPASTNAFLTSLALNPADSMTPGFTSNGFAYYATNIFGITPTLTVTDADLTATNKLTVNGLAYQLASGVPSLVLTNLGVGSTNVLKVLVTAQDGVTTNLYTINLTGLAQVLVNTNTFAITNMVSGGSLNLSWPVDHKGWRLQVQTNSASAGLGTNWYDWPNSTNLTSVSVPLNPANPSVFLRMVYP